MASRLAVPVLLVLFCFAVPTAAEEPEPAGVRIEGQVVDEAGTAVPGVRVLVRHGPQPGSASDEPEIAKLKTDEEGRFVATGLHGEMFGFRVRAEGLSEEECTAVQAATHRELVAGGRALIATTVVDGVPHLKFTILNPAVTSGELEELVDVVEEAALRHVDAVRASRHRWRGVARTRPHGPSVAVSCVAEKTMNAPPASKSGHNSPSGRMNAIAATHAIEPSCSGTIHER